MNGITVCLDLALLRMVLDCVHMALEDGGITRKELNGSDTAVYIGNHSYLRLMRELRFLYR